MTDAQTRDLIAELNARIVQTALVSDDLEAILTEICKALSADGMPLLRVVLAMPTVDPNVRAISAVWERSGGAVTHVTPHGRDGDAGFSASPISHVLQRNRDRGRFRLERGEGLERFPLLAELRARGGTDYYLRLVPFPMEPALQGMALTLTTDREGGFSLEELRQIDRLLPSLGLASYRIALTRLAHEVLGFYLGQQTSERVLAGEILRGSGQKLRAAILFADVRHFTTVSSRTASSRTIAWLNEIFECLGRPIEAAEGEVLKFLGDGLLAIFPMAEGAGAEEAACERALAAACEGLAAIEAFAGKSAETGMEPPEVDIALHFGDVFYGNIGAARRLDFTVIGPAVNETARLETLCEQQDRNLLLSGAFAARLTRPTQPIGQFTLRGLPAPLEVHSLE